MGDQRKGSGGPPPERLPSDALVAREPRERLPSAVLHLDSAGSPPAQAPPSGSARNAYVPPRIPPNAKLPRAVEQATPFVVQWLHAIIRALRGIHMYSDNNKRRGEQLDQCHAALAVVLERAGELVLEVREDRILCGRDTVHYNAEPFESLPRLLWDGGLRRIRLRRGITRLEVVRMLAAFSTDFSRPENTFDDLVAVMGRMGLVNASAEGEPPRPAAAPPAAVPITVPVPAAKAPPPVPSARMEVPASVGKLLPPAPGPRPAPPVPAAKAAPPPAKPAAPAPPPVPAAREALPSGLLDGLAPLPVLRTAELETLIPVTEPIPVSSAPPATLARALGGSAGLPEDRKRVHETQITESLTVPVISVLDEDEESGPGRVEVITPPPAPRRKSRARGASKRGGRPVGRAKSKVSADGDRTDPDLPPADDEATMIDGTTSPDLQSLVADLLETAVEHRPLKPRRGSSKGRR